MKPRAIIITGPTGAGKSAAALILGRALGGEIINADSLALYRGLDIGTAKPTPAERAQVPHHLVDVLNPDQVFSAADFLRAALPVIERLNRAGRPALVVGGTGFYLRGLQRGLFQGPGRNEDFRRRLAAREARGLNLHALLSRVDPASAAHLAPADRVRLERALEVFFTTGRPMSRWQAEHGLAEEPVRTLTLVLDRPAAEMDRRLGLRTRAMFEAGLPEEVAGLWRAGWSAALKPLQSIGYKEAGLYLRGLLGYGEAVEKTYVATRRLAKRQRTWFRGQMPEALWLHPEDDAARLRGLILDFLQQNSGSDSF